MKTFNNDLKIYFNYNKTLDNKFKKAFIFDNFYMFMKNRKVLTK